MAAKIGTSWSRATKGRSTDGDRTGRGSTAMNCWPTVYAAICSAPSTRGTAGREVDSGTTITLTTGMTLPDGGVVPGRAGRYHPDSLRRAAVIHSGREPRSPRDFRHRTTSRRPPAAGRPGRREAGAARRRSARYRNRQLHEAGTMKEHHVVEEHRSRPVRSRNDCRTVHLRQEALGVCWPSWRSPSTWYPRPSRCARTPPSRRWCRSSTRTSPPTWSARMN